MDVDGWAMDLARPAHPSHRFKTEVPSGERFDTVVSLAVIEHVDNPDAHLCELAGYLKPDGRVVLTTLRPGTERIYELGGRLRLGRLRLLHGGAADHRPLLGKDKIRACARSADLELVSFRYFLAGLNQLAVLRLRSRG